MSESNIYSPPESSLGDVESLEKKKPGALIIFFAIFLSIPLMATQFFAQYASIGLPGGIGGAIGALIPAFLVVLLFQIGRRFRNPKSRWRIYTWSQVVFLLGQVIPMLQLLSQNA